MRAGRPARLLFPALRWSGQTGYDHEEAGIEAALRLGVGGFILFGGTAEAASELTWRTQSRCDHALLFGSDLERGAGQQLDGATGLPPLAAVGALDDLEATRHAAALTAHEALGLGINWVLAPVADVDLEPRNPIVGTRAFGSDPERVAAHVAAWVEGCQAAGALACAKHFPGHGRTLADSHAELPRVTAGRAELERDLAPFRAAVAAGVAAIMTAHVTYPALDPSDTAATLSAPILHDLLRRTLGFSGLVASDAVIMQGLLEAVGGDEAHAALAAIRAGCDAVLYPGDLTAVATALEGALGAALPRRRVDEAVERIVLAAEQHPPQWRREWRRADAASWAAALAERCITRVRGRAATPPRLQLLVLDDDTGGPYPPPAREPFAAALAARGIEVVPVRAPAPERPLLIALFSDIRAWKGRPGLSGAALAGLRAALAVRGDALVVLFGHPRLAEDMPGENVVAAWGGESLMQQAAAVWLARHAERSFL